MMTSTTCRVDEVNMTEDAKDYENKMTAFMLVTQLDKSHFIGWSKKDLAAIDDPVQLMGKVAKRLEDAGAVVAALYAILHDRDFRMETGEDGKARKREVAPHMHIVGKFAERKKGLKSDEFLAAIGIGPGLCATFDGGRFEVGGKSMLIRADKRGYSFDNMLAYLIHAKDDGKFKYEPEDVVTYSGCGCEPYLDIARRKRARWAAGRATKNSMKGRNRVNVSIVEQRILDGELGKHDLLLEDDLYLVYSRNARRLDEALRVAAARRMLRSAEGLSRGDFCKTTLFVNGRPGTGKTVFLKSLCGFLEAEFEWDVSALAAKNALDDYDGSEVVFMDDVRDGAMSAEDWLRFIDPYNASRGSARYHNTESAAPRLVIVSSNKDPYEFFKDVRGVSAKNKAETVETFLRRITLQVEVDYPDEGWANFTLRKPERVEWPNDDGEPEGMAWVLSEPERCSHIGPYEAADEIVRLIYERNPVWAQDYGMDVADAVYACRRAVHEGYMPKGKSLDSMPSLGEPQAPSEGGSGQSGEPGLQA